ncbi:Axonemal Inner Arm I1 Intermediate Chain Dynein [Phytophthora cinnamomi]|nr:Axonemal Inner Arm I1 Intermediate Chain Dynein [Phytophthora cinnamomi]
MLRVAALAKMEPSMEPRGWLHHDPLTPPKAEPAAAAPTMLLPPIATAVARSGEGLMSSATLQSSWQPDVRRAPTLVTRANI